LKAAVTADAKTARDHAGEGASAVLGVTFDASELGARGTADQSAARAAYARAAGWLTAAPMALVAKTEVAGAELPVGRVRASTRAALLLAHVVDFDVDAEAASAWRTLDTVSTFFGGTSDDPSLGDLAHLGSALGIDVRDLSTIVDTAKIDRLRHELLARRSPKIFDGTSSLAPRPIDTAFARASLAARVLPARDAADAEVLQSLVFPAVGTTASGAPRTTPRALDVAAWLGSTDARAILHDDSDDAYAGYDVALQKLYDARPGEGSRHDSVYASSLDAIATILAPSAADQAQPAALTNEWRRRRLSVALAAWAALRHDAQPFSRLPLSTVAPPMPPEPPAALPVTAFVEPAPEAIAKLVALVRQTSRGMRALASLPADSPTRALLDRVESVLRDALAIAIREANDEPLASEEAAALDAMPDRLVGIERALEASHAADSSVVADVHTNFAVTPPRALEEATGDLDDLFVVVRAPRTGRLVLAVGAALPHYELTQNASDRLSDAAWRTRLHGPFAPPRDAFTRAWLVNANAPTAKR
jgi:hypothetical protein